MTELSNLCGLAQVRAVKKSCHAALVFSQVCIVNHQRVSLPPYLLLDCDCGACTGPLPDSFCASFWLALCNTSVLVSFATFNCVELGESQSNSAKAQGRSHSVRFEQLCLAPGDEPCAFDDTDFATATLGCPSLRMA